MRKNSSVSATVPAEVKSAVVDIATQHGMSIAALMRELLIRIAAGDASVLAWLDEAQKYRKG